MKNNILHYILILFSLAFACSCGKPVDKNITWPQWASRPIVENAGLAGVNGSNAVVAGDQVLFTAQVHDDYSTLVSADITISYEGKTAAVIEVPVSGNKADIDVSFKMPFAAGLTDNLVPEVSLTVINADNGQAVKRLDADHNVTISRPEIGSELFIVDSKGGVFRIARNGDGFDYATEKGTDLSSIGDKFVIAAKVNGTLPDFSKLVWGKKGNGIASIEENGEWIPTPSTEGYGFKNIAFNTYSFEMEKTVNYSVTVDKEEMESQEQSGVTYLVRSKQALVRDCEVVFKGFGDLSSMLQVDRFKVVDSNTAKFTGHSRNWTFFYDVDDNWMILNYVNFNEPEQVWVTGEKACFPLGNDTSEHAFKYLSSDGKDRYATLAGVADEDGVYRCLVYLCDGFTIQLYSWVKWSTVISMNSLSEEYCYITDDGIYMRPGNEFVPGVYMLKVKHTKMPDAGGDGAVADVWVEPYKL